MKKFLSRLSALPIGTKRLMGLGAILALVAALPLFIWAIVSQRFELREKAQTTEPVSGNPINWVTSDVSITASHFNVVSNGKTYYGNGLGVIVIPGPVDGNPGSVKWASIEIQTTQYGDDLRMKIYFKLDGSTWDVEEVGIKNSNYSDNWYSYKGPYISTTLGSSYNQDGDYAFVLMDPTTGQPIAQVIYSNLHIQAFTNLSPSPNPANLCPGAEACPASSGILRNCHPPEADNTPQESICNFGGRREFCGGTEFCCPQAGGVWSINLSVCPTPIPTPYPTPTPTPALHTSTPTATPSPGLHTSTPSPYATATTIPGTPPPTVRGFEFNVKLAGVNDGRAEGAKIVLGFSSKVLNSILYTPPISLYHVGNGVYRALVGIMSDQLPSATDYSIRVKGEKHLSKRFCYQSGQTQRCPIDGKSFIRLPTPYHNTLFFDFTGMALEPGDLPPQDNGADPEDFAKIKSLLSKPCADLTESEKMTADIDYNGCINVRDAFLMRKSLETRYDD